MTLDLPCSCSLKDGRTLTVALATAADLDAIAQAHPLPRNLEAPEPPLRAYYRAKAWLYVTGRSSGILVGRVEGQLAGFVFYCGDTVELARLARSPRGILWGMSQLVIGRTGGPRLWVAFARWCRQHFRAASKYEGVEATEPMAQGGTPTAWIDTIETLPEFRRLGVASCLLAAAKAVLATQGASVIGSWVAEDNLPSIGLFENQGFHRAVKVQRLGERCWLMLAETDPSPLCGT